MIKKTLTLLLLLLAAHQTMEACTNLIVTRGASKDSSVMVTYAADSHQLYGELYFRPAADYPDGALLDIYEWDTGKKLGQIPQVAHTYSVTGNMNEHQVVIAETTFGGRKGFYDSTAVMDYGSLIYVALQRSKTAREAIHVIDDLMQRYGYASSGESFSIADANEVWIMEIMGKAPKFNKKGVNVNKGAVWVAKRIPDGSISAHANQARITTIDFNDKDNCLYSKDVITHARQQGIFDGKDEEFSFSDVYAPLDFGACRYCEARVWSFFRRFAEGMDAYQDYAMGYDLTHRMPLYVTPTRKLDVKDLADMMRDHYEGTPMDMTLDAGAGGSACPYRWRPMEFTVDGKTYLNERAIATQQTGWWFVSQSRNWLPDAIGGVYWFGVDDAGTSPLTPLYASTTAVPDCLKEGNGSLLEYSSTAMFWLVSRIAQFAYLRYDKIGAEVRSVIDRHERQSMQQLVISDQHALTLQNNPKALSDYLTQVSLSRSQQLFEQWQALDTYLLVKYIDGNQKRQHEDGRFQDNGYSKRIPASPLQEGYSESWKRQVVQDHSDVLEVK